MNAEPRYEPLSLKLFIKMMEALQEEHGDRICDASIEELRHHLAAAEACWKAMKPTNARRVGFAGP